jgi:23S rRNA (guanine745-N1)-methyltransferase
VTSSCLACTVRDCGRALVHEGRALVCSAGHTFDLARAGYVNLLQPQDRRSPRAGDSREAVDARARLLSLGIGRHLVEQIVAEARALSLPTDASVLDLGCGTGELLADLTAGIGCRGIGIDLSVTAIERAARRHSITGPSDHRTHGPADPRTPGPADPRTVGPSDPRTLTWLVANADRRLPILDSSVALITTMHGRRNAPESARVLAGHGRLFVIVPGVHDLRELREAIDGRATEQDRVPGVLAEHATHFRFVRHRPLQEHHRLEPDALRLLLNATYRGVRHSVSDRVESLGILDVTLASDLLVFERP